MKKILLPILASLFTFTLAAQEIKAPVLKSYTSELGIFGQTEAAGGDDQSIGIVGLQYKHWHTEHLGYRIIAAFAQYSSSGSKVQYASGDTSVTRQEHFDCSLPIFGFGIEAQRHFYKKVYLFAAAELGGGYGSGISDTSVSSSIGRGAATQHLGENIGRRDANLLYIGLTASVGAKVQWSRICVGLEVSPVHMAYTKINDGTNRGGMADLNAGSFSQRLFLHWRF